MKVHEFQTELWVPEEQEQVFSFFADAANLDAITPPWLHFKIVTPMPVAMHEGTFIDYRLRVRGMWFKWKTRINEWVPSVRFVDEQVQGPYQLWIHEHTFHSQNGGTVVRDKVRYATPLDSVVHRWLVRPDIRRIFEFRAKALQKRLA